MSSPQEGETFLSPYRVLDLSDEGGLLCGKVLGDLGADVILVEEPSGHPARNIGPFYHNIPDREKSLFWFAYNANKRGITLDIKTADGQDIFKKLVKSADFVLESYPPGHMDRLGLGYSALATLNPRIIVTSITAFGQTGPYMDYKASDLICMAMGGILFMTGDPDHPPVRVSIPQAYLVGSLEAAMATMVAHHYREVSGEGQHVDTSTQHSCAMLIAPQLAAWALGGTVTHRAGSYRGGHVTGVLQRQVWHCKDGFVAFTIRGHSTGARVNRALVEWLDEKGVVTDFMKTMDWDRLDMSAMTREMAERIEEPITKLFMAYTKMELYGEALRRRITLYPICSPKEIVQNPQLQSRAFWEQVEHSELDDTITYPGAFVKASITPCVIRRRAPLIGEHNREMYCQELGLSEGELNALKQAGVV